MLPCLSRLWQICLLKRDENNAIDVKNRCKFQGKNSASLSFAVDSRASHFQKPKKDKHHKTKVSVSQTVLPGMRVNIHICV